MSSQLHSKRLFKRVIYSKIAVVILILVTAITLKAGWGAYQKMSISGEKVRQARSERNELIEERNILNENLGYLETRRGVEEELRKKYSLAKEGERMVVIVDSEPDDTTAVEVERSVLGEIWHAVTNFFK